MSEDTTQKKSGYLGNKNATKDETLDDQTTFRHLKAERAAWMRAKGKDGKLATWVRETLNKEAGYQG